MTKSTSPDGNRLDRLDTFVIAGVVTILFTRAFLAATGFPQLGGSGLHIAHVLWGGGILTAAFLLVLLAETRNKLFAALLGGVGFGLFIDEVGKFVTNDHDYFYRPAIGLMYVSFLLIWVIARLLIARAEKRTFLSPAEWPGKRWMRTLIVLWCSVQFSFGVALTAGLVVFGPERVGDTLNIPELGLVTAFVYTVLLGYGLWRFQRADKLKAAHDLRGATLAGIVGAYPFFYLNHPELASLAITPTLLVMIGLSDVSVISLVKKLLAR